MHPRIELLPEKRLVGKRIKMSLAENKTGELWRNFMPRRREIPNNLTNDLISMQVYSEPMRLGDLHQVFDKWATIEVTDFGAIPKDMETYLLPAGLYAVFLYKGLSTDTKVFEYIYGTWLPNSNYILDHRPTFEILGEKYRNNDPSSEEEIWIPIQLKEQGQYKTA